MAYSTQKELAWLSCKPKTCCHNAFVIVSGRDIWRISRTLGTPPWSYLIYFQSPEWRPDAFILDRSERYFRLALTKQPAGKRRKSPPPCIFLMRTRNGHHRCGLGDLRPQACKTFPVEKINGVLAIPYATGCTCRAWSLADVNLQEEAAFVEERERDLSEYYSLVAEWNSMVMSAPQEAEISLFDYCNFLLRAYDEMEAQGAVQVAASIPSESDT